MDDEPELIEAPVADRRSSVDPAVLLPVSLAVDLSILAIPPSAPPSQPTKPSWPRVPQAQSAVLRVEPLSDEDLVVERKVGRSGNRRRRQSRRRSIVAPPQGLPGAVAA